MITKRIEFDASLRYQTWKTNLILLFAQRGAKTPLLVSSIGKQLVECLHLQSDHQNIQSGYTSEENAPEQPFFCSST